ncbi:hypothetical protein FRIGORI9N_370023 [Frigoribacterium sp. 9N]|nr:hypothetical protein FRIGORI9N_370023 [Frigoribacterium sp. 9N]
MAHADAWPLPVLVLDPAGPLGARTGWRLRRAQRPEARVRHRPAAVPRRRLLIASTPDGGGARRPI